jgi:mycothiol synthase
VQAAEITLRAPTRADAAVVAEVLDAHGLATGGAASETEESVASWFDLESLDPASDMFLALDGQELAGYADVNAPGDGSIAFIDVRVPPGREDALGTLLDAVLRRAAERAAPRGRVRAPANERDEPYRAALAERGFAVIRSSFTMTIELTSPTGVPSWPEGLRSRPFRRGEERAVYDAYVDAFADHWGFVPESFADWCTWNLAPDDDTTLWRVVDDGGEVAGLCLGKPSRGEDREWGWVSILAVRRPWRRRGLARALLVESFDLFRAIGRARAGLGVDAENTTGALALYEGVGMQVESRSDTWELAL